MNFKENETAEKLRGHYYTDPQIASFLTRWVLELQPTSILEPGCGDGIFIETIANSLNKCHKLKSVIGFEIEPKEAEKARGRGNLLREIEVDIHTEEFLSWSLLNFFNKPLFDGVLGNPPFIRYQYLTDSIQEKAKKLHDLFDLKFTKHTNAWVPFVVSSIAFLRSGGRLAMVVPSEILHVPHAESLRRFLISQCSKILVFDPVELWFDNVLQGTVLLLAEKKHAKNDECRGVAIIPTEDRAFLNGSANEYFENANYVNGKILNENKWMRALLTSGERNIIDSISCNPAIFLFNKVAEVDVGIVTGANKFFLVPDSTVTEFKLQKWAYPMFGRSEHVKGIIYDKRNHNENRKLGFPTNFLWFNKADKLSSSVQNYLRLGEEQDLRMRYKCRIRNPWYCVPSVYVSKLGMLKRCHDFHRLIYNKAKAFTTDTAYRIKAARGISEKRLVFSFINSLTSLSAELEGRHYGGGVLELVPSEIERVFIPMPIISFDLEKLDMDFRNGVSPEEILFHQDESILKAVGLAKHDRKALFSAWDRLRRRRQRISNVSA